MTCDAHVVLKSAKPMVHGVLRLGTHGARVPCREEPLLMGIVTRITGDPPTVVQRHGTRGTLGGTRIPEQLRPRKTHGRLHLVGRHKQQHVRCGNYIYVRAPCGVIPGHPVATAAHARRLTTQRVQHLRLRSHAQIRDVRVAPQTRIRLDIVGIQLIVHVEGPVLLFGMALKTEHHGVGQLASSQGCAGR